jgi:hypothetical protein
MCDCQPDHSAGHLRSGQPWDLKRALASTKQPQLAHVRLDRSWSHDAHAASRAATCCAVRVGWPWTIALVSEPIALARLPALLIKPGGSCRLECSSVSSRRFPLRGCRG